MEKNKLSECIAKKVKSGMASKEAYAQCLEEMQTPKTKIKLPKKGKKK